MRKQRLQRHYILRGFHKKKQKQKKKQKFEAKIFHVYLFNSGTSEEVRGQ